MSDYDIAIVLLGGCLIFYWYALYRVYKDHKDE